MAPAEFLYVYRTDPTLFPAHSLLKSVAVSDYINSPNGAMADKAAEAAGVVDSGMEQQSVVQPSALPPMWNGVVLPPPYSAEAPIKYVDYHGESGYSHMQYHPKQRAETYVVTVCKPMSAKPAPRIT